MTFDIFYFLIFYLLFNMLILELEIEYYIFIMFFGMLQLILVLMSYSLLTSLFSTFTTIENNLFYTIVLVFSIIMFILSLSKLEKGIRL